MSNCIPSLILTLNHTKTNPYHLGLELAHSPHLHGSDNSLSPTLPMAATHAALSLLPTRPLVPQLPLRRGRAPHQVPAGPPRVRQGAATAARCGVGIGDFIGGDLLRLDLGKWLEDVEKHKALAIYSPHEGGYEGRYLTRLRYQGYYFLDLSARGLGDPEATLTKVHPVCPVSFQ